MYLFIHSFIFVFIYLFIHSFTYSFIHLFIHFIYLLLIYLFIIFHYYSVSHYLFILLIYLFIHLFIPPHISFSGLRLSAVTQWAASPFKLDFFGNLGAFSCFCIRSYGWAWHS